MFCTMKPRLAYLKGEREFYYQLFDQYLNQQIIQRKQA
jgi:hypothetical protein